VRERIRITIDTREQAPWHFPEELAEVEVGTLRTGDYALTGDAGFALERKSLDDFLGTIGTGWARFCREIGRMDAAGFPAKVIVVEGDFASVCFAKDGDDVVPPQHRHPLMTPQFVVKRLAELTMMGVAVLFCGNSDYAAGVAFQILKERDNDFEG
jgi:hypothetical protein